MRLAEIKSEFLKHRARDLDCGGCVECCRGDAIFLHPECGDDVSMYDWEPYEGRPILKHKPNGDCIYLGDKGCTIHDRAPVICRELDCRLLVADARFRDAVQSRKRRKALEKAARRLDRRMSNVV